jgi:hypothetical protein
VWVAITDVWVAITVAVIALVGSVFTTALTIWSQKRSADVAAKRDAEAVLARYREPLIAAAYELQGRLYNILQLGFLGKYYSRGDEAQKTYAVQNTLYVLAQYFGWSEILRREIQFLSFSDSKQTRDVADRQREVLELFQSDDPELGRPFLVWRGEQRAIGECMIEREDGRVSCQGYASFFEHRGGTARKWLNRLEQDLESIAEEPNLRLIRLQHGLVDLIRELDPDRLRYGDDELQKVKEG